MTTKMKYYLYISDAKVNMLWEQIRNVSPSKKSIEIKLDVKLFSSSFQEEFIPINGRIQKLQEVEKYIRKHSSVGTLDNPDDFIADTMDMQWNIDTQDLPLVYMWGYRSLSLPPLGVCLGGSAKHLISSNNDDENNTGTISNHPSLIPNLLRNFGRALQESNRLSNGWTEKMENEVRRNFLLNDVPKRRMEFLVKSLLPAPYTISVMHGDFEAVRLYIGTPLYVAFA